MFVGSAAVLLVTLISLALGSPEDPADPKVQAPRQSSATSPGPVERSARDAPPAERVALTSSAAQRVSSGSMLDRAAQPKAEAGTPLARLLAPWRAELVDRNRQRAAAPLPRAQRLGAAHAIVCDWIAYSLETSGAGETAGRGPITNRAGEDLLRFTLDGRNYRFADGDFPIWDELAAYRRDPELEVNDSFFTAIDGLAAEHLSLIR